MMHGLWLTGASLMFLARHLRRCGFAVYPFSYSSVRKDLRGNAIGLQQFVERIDAPTVHFVGHSLGGIVIRALFHYFPQQRPGRIVTLASPHGGTHVGERIAQTRFGRYLLGASVRQVLEQLPEQWVLPSRDIGVVIGTMPIGGGRLFSNRHGPGDGLLTIEESSLAGATDTVMLPIAHSGLPFSRRAAEQVCRFLMTGRFQQPAA